MRVLVTGSTGYLGQEVVNALLSKPGLEVVGWGRDPETLRLIEQRFHSSREHLRLDRVDLLDDPLLPKGTDTVVHCAAVRVSSTRHPDSVMHAVNVGATERLVERACKRKGIRFVYISSQSVYGLSGAPWSEETVTTPVSEYGRTKLDGERIVLGCEGRMDAAILRLSRLYGWAGFARWDELPAVLCRAAAKDARIVVHGTGKARFDLIHVRDVARCVADIAVRRSLRQSIYNVGSGNSVSLRQLACHVTEAAIEAGFERPATDFLNGTTDDRRHLELRSDRVCCDTGWMPRISLAKGLGELFQHVADLGCERDWRILRGGGGEG